jgi:hypothetical protein
LINRSVSSPVASTFGTITTALVELKLQVTNTEIAAHGVRLEEAAVAEVVRELNLVH